MLLTKKRQTWANNRGAVNFEGKTLTYNSLDMRWYRNALLTLVKKMVQIADGEIEALFKSKAAKEYFSQDENIASQARIVTNRLRDKFDSMLSAIAPVLAERMVKRAARSSKTALHSSLKKLSGGLSIKTSVIRGDLKTALKSAIAQNVSLIKSIGEEYSGEIQRSVLYSITNGQGYPTIKKKLVNYQGVTERRAKNIALDQTRKTYNLLNVERCKKLGLNKFKWVHSFGGQRPRKDHIEMNGKIYRFDDPPVIDKKTGETGYPGQAINCRCTLVPVIEFEQD